MSNQYNKITVVECEGRERWEQLLVFCKHVNLMQSWEYGEAKSGSLLFRPKRLELVDENGETFGLMQVLTFSLPFVGGVARINRGPLLFENVWDDEVPDNIITKAVVAICEAVSKFRWWYLLLSPEFPLNDRVETILKDNGFRLKNSLAWGSAFLSLERSEEEIMASFHSKWRNLLRKAEKSGLELEHGNHTNDLAYLLENYETLKQKKQFSGISENLFKKMAAQKGNLWKFCVLFAKKGGERVGGVIFTGHGDSCTYLVGWVSDEGRKLMSSYFLVWHAILFYKKSGYQWFDIGGLNEETPKGVAHFKQGLKGKPYRIVGEWVLY